MYFGQKENNCNQRFTDWCLLDILMAKTYVPQSTKASMVITEIVQTSVFIQV